MWEFMTENLLVSHLLRRLCLPHLYRLIIASRGDARAIRQGYSVSHMASFFGGEVSCSQGRVPRHHVHSIAVVTIGQDVRPIAGLPYLYRLVVTARGEKCTTGRPGYGVHNIGVPAVGQNIAAISSFPDAHRAVGTGGSDTCSIG